MSIKKEKETMRLLTDHTNLKEMYNTLGSRINNILNKILSASESLKQNEQYEQTLTDEEKSEINNIDLNCNSILDSTFNVLGLSKNNDVVIIEGENG